MQKLSELYAAPTGFDSLENYCGPDLSGSDLLVLLTRTRDSDVLTESNWDKALEALGGESDTVIIHRFGHWAVGWIEYLCVRSGSAAAEIAEDIDNALADYPVLDESDFCERESDAADKLWADWPVNWRIDYIRKNRNQFDFQDFRDLLACARGQYFGGCASDLLH
jgi:hypothetical protein